MDEIKDGYAAYYTIRLGFIRKAGSNWRSHFYL